MDHTFQADDAEDHPRTDVNKFLREHVDGDNAYQEDEEERLRVDTSNRKRALVIAAPDSMRGVAPSPSLTVTEPPAVTGTHA
jgi:hypothetical protein